MEERREGVKNRQKLAYLILSWPLTLPLNHSCYYTTTLQNHCTYFSSESMWIWSSLADMDWNANCGRKQLRNRDGSLRFRMKVITISKECHKKIKNLKLRQ